MAVLPIVHLNGTSRERLLAVRDVAYCKLDAAMDAMRDMAPNGRDYYPQPGLMEKAVEQHQRRLSVVKALMDEIQEEVDAMFFEAT